MPCCRNAQRIPTSRQSPRRHDPHSVRFAMQRNTAPQPDMSWWLGWAAGRCGPARPGPARPSPSPNNPSTHPPVTVCGVAPTLGVAENGIHNVDDDGRLKTTDCVRHRLLGHNHSALRLGVPVGHGCRQAGRQVLGTACKELSVMPVQVSKHAPVLDVFLHRNWG